MFTRIHTQTLGALPQEIAQCNVQVSGRQQRAQTLQSGPARPAAGLSARPPGWAYDVACGDAACRPPARATNGILETVARDSRVHERLSQCVLPQRRRQPCRSLTTAGRAARPSLGMWGFAFGCCPTSIDASYTAPFCERSRGLTLRSSGPTRAGRATPRCYCRFRAACPCGPLSSIVSAQ